MTQDHIYDGAPDDRVAAAPAPSRFRKRYRPLSPDEIALHDAIKDQAEKLEALLEQIPAGRYRALGFTALEEAVMWAVKELTA